MQRVKIEEEKSEKEKVGSYFFKDRSSSFVTSGCLVLDKIMSGGYPVGRIINIVGDKSTCKTLLAIEACANFYRKFPDGEIYYHEAEAAFDKEYAAVLGMPIETINFVRDENLTEQELTELATVEGLFKKFDVLITEQAKRKTKKKQILYVMDSLDALSDKAEQEREMGEGTYGANKAKAMSEMFRRLVTKLNNANITIIFISQIRDKIGVMFGRKWDRSGGHALDFYASVVVYLAEVEKIKKTVRGIERVRGIWIKAKSEKNKVGLPFRDCEFPAIFGYGIDDLIASIFWLKQVKGLEELGLDPKMGDAAVYDFVEEHRGDTELVKKIEDQVNKIWAEVDKEFLPTRSKYK